MKDTRCVCPIAGCNFRFARSITGWHKHILDPATHPHWHADVEDVTERQRLYQEEFPKFFEVRKTMLPPPVGETPAETLPAPASAPPSLPSETLFGPPTFPPELLDELAGKIVGLLLQRALMAKAGGSVAPKKRPSGVVKKVG